MTMNIKNLFYLLVGVFLVWSCGDDGTEEEYVITNDRISVTPNLQLLAEGQVAELTIEANCNWTITVSDSWLSVTPLSGSNTQKISVSAGKNSTGTERHAVIKVSNGKAIERSVMVTQPSTTENTGNEPRNPNAGDNQPPT